MKNKLITILLITTSTLAYSQIGKKVQFVGGARSLVSHSYFNSDGDTTTAPKSTGGYALLDLGVKINPNKNTEILGMFRINNEFGGFWGGGVSFDVRQLYVRGVAANFLRYQIGHLDYKLTPYTFYNHNTDFLTRSIGSNLIKEDIVNYESFYSKNTWRQQGASANFAIEFPKVIKETEFNAFISRLNPAISENILERLYGGGNMIITQSDQFQLGVNHVSIFDLLGTALDSNQYRNNVSSISYSLNLQNESFSYGFDGESGMSFMGHSLNPEDDLSDYFAHIRTFLNFKKQKINLDLGYLNNGPDFRSFGAQSKRVNFDQTNNFYQRYTNDQTLRALSMYDLYNDPNLYRQGISVGVMNYNPSISNALPYGIASFNRQGVYLGASYTDQKNIIQADGKLNYLSEIRGQGTTELKSFALVQANGLLNLNKLWKGKKSWRTQLSLAYQSASRKGKNDFQVVDLNSTQINFGIEGELFENFFFMANLFMLSASGMDQLPIRDANDEIINYSMYDILGTEYNTSFGLRFDFSEKVLLAAMYEMNSNDFNVNTPYQYNQMSIIYIMKF